MEVLFCSAIVYLTIGLIVLMISFNAKSSTGKPVLPLDDSDRLEVIHSILVTIVVGWVFIAAVAAYDTIKSHIQLHVARALQKRVGRAISASMKRRRSI